MKKKTVSKGKPKNLRAKGLSPKRAASVKGGDSKRAASVSEITVTKSSDISSTKLFKMD